MKSVRIIRKDDAAVSPVIATILMVAITVVLAAVLYVMVSGLITPVGGNKPVLTFSAASLSSGNATIAVAGTSQSVSPSNYRVNVERAGVIGTAMPMPTTSGGFVVINVGTTATWRVYWTDIGGEGTINAGDQFRVTGINAQLQPTSSFVFTLLWSDGSAIQTSAWQTA